MNGAVIDGGDEFTQCLDGIVDRIGDRAGDVFGHRRLHREVAVEPSAVCDEISRTTCMFFEILPDIAACWRALAEMFCTRLAI